MYFDTQLSFHVICCEFWLLCLLLVYVQQVMIQNNGLVLKVAVKKYFFTGLLA